MMTGSGTSANRSRYQHARRTLGLCERDEIFRALVEDSQGSLAEIVRQVGRPPTSVAREVAGGGEKGRSGVDPRRSAGLLDPPARNGALPDAVHWFSEAVARHRLDSDAPLWRRY